MKIFCISIFDQNHKQLKDLGLIPVGLGKKKFHKNWLTDKKGKNISNKNLNFGEYTFHYKLWHNQNLITNSNEWIGFCTYRRFWTISNDIKLKRFKELEKIIIKKPLNHWKKFDVILGNPVIFKKIKNIKLIKRSLFEVIKKPSMLFKDNTLEDQFRVFHGSYFLDTAINLMPIKYQEDFKRFMKGNTFYPYNMFICKNHTILKNFIMKFFRGYSNVKKLLKKKS